MMILILIGREAPPLTIGNLLFMLLLSGSVVGVGVWSIFKLMRSDLFTGKANSKMTYVKAGLLGALGFGVILIVAYFMPDWGFEITVEWWVYLVIGTVLLTIVKIVRMKEHKLRSTDGAI